MKELFATVNELPAMHADLSNKASAVFANFGNVSVNGGGTTKHSRLSERELPDQHPISAITGLDEALKNAGTKFTTDETLNLENGVLSVNTATGVEEDNTLPITSAAVAQTVGNIEILLKTI